jgi:DNA-binding PadR family transcriptional regulator
MPRTPREPFSTLGSFSEVAFNILIALAEEPKHGYAMMRDIDAMTGSRPGPGTLYAAIARLEQKRWIEPMAADDRRRPYRLTSEGRKILRARLASLRTMARIAQSRLARQS